MCGTSLNCAMNYTCDVKIKETFSSQESRSFTLLRIFSEMLSFTDQFHTKLNHILLFIFKTNCDFLDF